MCGRYTLIANAEAIRLLFKLPAFDERLVVPRYNIAPTQPIAIVRQGPKGRELVPVRWGFIPNWAEDPNLQTLLINARAEGIAERPAFRGAFRYRRCLVPASAFYEWQARGKSKKQPFAVRPVGQELIALAGVWEDWLGADGSEIDTAAIITTDANEALGDIHPRMPVIIDAKDFETWLSPRTPPDEAAALLKPAPSEMLAYTPVSTRVNSADNDDAGLLEEVLTEAEEAAAPEPDQMRLI